MTDRDESARVGPGSVVAPAVAAIVLALLAGAVLASQVEVTDAAAGATRACGSAVDGLVDRSGWEIWWAADLGEPDDTVRAALVRTTRCPDAVNARIVVAAVLGGAAAVAAFVAARLGRARRSRRSLTDAATARLVRLGRAVTVAGTVLTVAGVAAVAVLVADADSTLFLYTDRFVVAVVGLIVLVPTVSLIVLGRVVAAFADADAVEPRGDGIDADAT